VFVFGGMMSLKNVIIRMKMSQKGEREEAMITKKDCQQIVSWATERKIKACQDCPILHACNEYHFEKVRGKP